ncbi:hypothetical protein BH11PSE12_BH11PSE12_07640 [soil metagenome]
MSLAISAGLSGLHAYQRALDMTSHNIANAGTAGFTPEQANFHEAHNAGVVVNISNDGNTEAHISSALQQNISGSGTELAREIVNTLTYKVGFDLSIKLIKTSNAMLGTLIDIKS